MFSKSIDMDFRFRAFLAVAKHLSFTRASKELGVSQPAVTKHIQELENIYSVNLFERSGGHISLTEQGAKLQEYAERIVLEHELLRMEMSLAVKNAEGSIRIATDRFAAGMIFSELLPQFMEKYPRIKLSIEIAGQDTSVPDADMAIYCGDEGLQIKNLCGEDGGISPQAQILMEFIGIFQKRKGLDINI